MQGSTRRHGFGVARTAAIHGIHLTPVIASSLFFFRSKRTKPPHILPADPRSGFVATERESYGRRSWRQRADKYLRPFSLDIHVSSSYVTASVQHRVTHHVVAVATTNSKLLREFLSKKNDLKSCRIIGETLAERARDVDVYAVVYHPKTERRYADERQLVAETIADNGLIIMPLQEVSFHRTDASKFEPYR
eukprot:TRINITY_DN8231_c0_g1_i1.p1 TRINITY_DN8231_c0_g1~~TRINITY_DN8231_c0_g1_i1.p1  ORF type:complete len:192 (+),score=31.09 TRINITY_DN8231_c0_g1_i1:18-593(+)